MDSTHLKKGTQLVGIGMGVAVGVALAIRLLHYESTLWSRGDRTVALSRELGMAGLPLTVLVVGVFAQYWRRPVFGLLAMSLAIVGAVYPTEWFGFYLLSMAACLLASDADSGRKALACMLSFAALPTFGPGGTEPWPIALIHAMSFGLLVAGIIRDKSKMHAGRQTEAADAVAAKA